MLPLPLVVHQEFAFTFTPIVDRSIAGWHTFILMNVNTEKLETPRLSTLDRFLPVWIVIAMVAGLLLGRGVPGLQEALDAVKVDNTSVLIALGLFAMMYPVLARVKYEEMGHLAGDRRMLWLSLLMN